MPFGKFLFIMLSAAVLQAEYRAREDSFFDKTDQKHYDYGFILDSSILMNLENIRLYRGVGYGFTQRKRVRKESAGFIMNFRGFVNRNQKYPPYSHEEDSFLLPVCVDANIYINSGKFEKGTGRYMPYAGLGLGLVNKKTTSAAPGYVKTTMKFGLIGLAQAGVEYMILPPAFGIRAALTGNSTYASAGNPNIFFKNFFKAGVFDFKAGVMFSLVAYVK